MKILIQNTFYHPDEPGGAERSVRSLAESLAQMGHQVTVVCLSVNRSTETINGVVVERLPVRNQYLPRSEETNGVSRLAKLRWHFRDSYNSRARDDLVSLLKKYRPDVFHTNNLAGFSPLIWQAARHLDIPVVHSTRDFYLLCPKATMMRGGRSCGNSCASCLPFSVPRRILTQNVDHVVGISNFILQRHLRAGCFKSASSSVIHNSFAPIEVGEVEPRAEVVIGFLGRLVREKGLELLIEAFKLVCKDGFPVALHVAGTGAPDYVERLKKLSGNLPIKFLGELKPEHFFRRIDFTVVPSIWDEPLGRVIIESLAFGKGVVTTPVGGMPELVPDSAGIVAESTSVIDLYAAMLKFMNRLRDSPSAIKAAARIASSEFVPAVIAERYVTAYTCGVNRSEI